MITAIGDVMREAYRRGWITTRDGNISLCRANSKIMYITPSGVRKSIIHPEHIVKVRFTKDGLSIADGVEPSGELHMHAMLQMNNRGHRAIVHLHPTNTISAMYAGFDLQIIAAEFPEVSRYTKVGPSVPVLPATSKELAESTFKAMTDSKDKKVIYDIVGQGNHGVCSAGANPWDAFEHIERLDHICEIVLKSGIAP